VRDPISISRVLPLLALLLSACDGDDVVAGPGCDEGYVDDAGTCVPEDCGTGTWGDLTLPLGTVYVDVEADPGEDGTKTAPFTSIQQGLDEAGTAGGGSVAVAAGTYAETLVFNLSHDGVELAGRCSPLVKLDASVGGGATPAISIDAAGSAVGISGIWIHGSQSSGVALQAGTATLRNCDVTDSAWYGVEATDSGGVAVALEIDSCTVDGSVAAGVQVLGAQTSAQLVDVAISGTTPLVVGERGPGLEVLDGAVVQAESCMVEGNVGAGVLVFGTGTSLTLLGSTVRDNVSDVFGDFGYGVLVMDGALLDARSCTVEGNRTAGVAVMDSGSMAALRDSVVADNLGADSGELGCGVYVIEGATVTVDSCEIERNTLMGIRARGAGTQVVVQDSIIADTLLSWDLYECTASIGAGAEDGAEVGLSGVELSGNAGPGLYSNGAGSVLTCSDCTLVDNQFAGGVVVGDGTLQIEDSTITDTGMSVDLGNGAGVYAESLHWGGSPTLVVSGSTVRGNPVQGIQLHGSGSFQLVDNDIEGGEGVVHGDERRCGDAVYASDGVAAWDGTTGLRIEHSSLTGGLTAGLMLASSSAVLSGNTWADNAVADIITQGAGCDDPPEGHEEAGTVELCPEWDYPTCYEVFSLEILIADLE